MPLDPNNQAVIKMTADEAMRYLTQHARSKIPENEMTHEDHERLTRVYDSWNASTALTRQTTIPVRLGVHNAGIGIDWDASTKSILDAFADMTDIARMKQVLPELEWRRCMSISGGISNALMRFMEYLGHALAHEHGCHSIAEDFVHLRAYLDQGNGSYIDETIVELEEIDEDIAREKYEKHRSAVWISPDISDMEPRHMIAVNVISDPAKAHNGSTLLWNATFDQTMDLFRRHWAGDVRFYSDSAHLIKMLRGGDNDADRS